jgi:hypothetical protein
LIGARVGVGIAGRAADGVGSAAGLALAEGVTRGSPDGTDATGIVARGGGSGGIGGIGGISGIAIDDRGEDGITGGIGGRAGAPGRMPVIGGINGLAAAPVAPPGRCPEMAGGTIGRGRPVGRAAAPVGGSALGGVETAKA